MINNVIGDKYYIKNKIGCGSFGEIYLGEDIHTHDFVAIKLELSDAKHQLLQYEVQVYKIINKNNDELGIPKLLWYGTQNSYNIMVIEHLGSSLEDLFNLCGRRFSLKTTLMLADQMLSLIQYIHSKNYIHRDIKPENFLMGIGNKKHCVHIIDFGLSKKYWHDGQHIKYKEGKNLVGTARYASISTHSGIEQSRRDDLESLGYIIIYFLRGSLPWQEINAKTKQQKYDLVANKKMEISIDKLCKRLPTEISLFIDYCRNLEFEEIPDYTYLKKLLRNLFINKGYVIDSNYDWEIKNKDENIVFQ
jgi:serine/threonine protein kinase